ncbi:hypothetical protein BDZ89DRAFT_1250161 [Hymenopellis radicata]|nr:hypothetical protein BDZ89DRAFT_1250161 [Hymenopellis radicata]
MSDSQSPPASPATALITARDALQSAHNTFTKAVKRFAEDDRSLSPSRTAQKRKVMQETNAFVGKMKKNLSNFKLAPPSKVTTATSSSARTTASSSNSSKAQKPSLDIEGDDDVPRWEGIIEKISDDTKKFYQDRVSHLWSAPTLLARDFKASLAAFPHTELDIAESELQAIERLLAAYTDHSNNWKLYLQEFKGSRKSYNQACVDAQTNEAEEDENKKLRNIETRLREDNSTNAGEQFVWFVLRTIESIRYIKIWNTHHQNRKWKTQLIEQTFADEFPELLKDDSAAGQMKKETLLKKYKRSHTTVIQARRELLVLYEKFGPGILLDRVWDADATRRGTRRSGRFRDIVLLLCVDNSHWVPIHSHYADSLYNILSILASKDVAEYAKDFLTQHPPMYHMTMSMAGD